MATSKSPDIKPGTKLDLKQAKELASELAQVLSAVGTRRRHMLLVHDSLQNSIGLFLQMGGWAIQYEVPFERGEWEAERNVFDIVAQKGTETVVVEVKDEVTTRDLGQVYGYANALQLSKVKAKLYLGTDILSYSHVLVGTVGEMMKELMEREDLGVILVDKYLMMVCDNYAQLALEEMPEFVASEHPVG